MRWLTIALLAAAVIGCAPKTPEAATTTDANAPGVTTPNPDPANATVSQSGDSGGISPMTTAPIGIAPVSGAESVGGGGSNVGSVAKDRAKQAAAQAGAPAGSGTEGE